MKGTFYIRNTKKEDEVDRMTKTKISHTMQEIEETVRKEERLKTKGIEALSKGNHEKALKFFKTAGWSEGVVEVIVDLIRSGDEEIARTVFDDYSQ